MTNMAPPAPNLPPSPQEGRRPLGEMFALGWTGITEQYMEGDVRFLEWYVSPEDEQLKEIAGWGKLIVEDIDANHRRLVLPAVDVRSASHVLPGTEAFDGEKRTIVDFMANYMKTVFDTYGAYDLHLTFDTVGVGRGNDSIMMLPPHRLSANQAEIETWYGALEADLQDLVAADPHAPELVEALRLGVYPKQ